jgi:hypothetical protein
MKYAAIAILILLTGCAKQPDPVTAINDQLQQDVSELLDYANNNMGDDPDTMLLKTGLKDCAARADAATKQHETSMQACEARTEKARAERNTLALVLIGIVLIKLKKMFV